MFDKVSLEKITLRVSEGKIIFKYVINDTRQVLLASGRIHQGTTIGQGIWTINTNILTLTVPQSTVIALEKIKESFNRMVS